MTVFNEMWLKQTFKSGRTNSMTGDKGGGKTHLAVLIMFILLKLGFNVYTNILFKRCVSIDKNGRKKFVEDYPPGIQKVESLTDLLRKVCLNLLDDPYKPSVFFWDELQNSLSAYDWTTELFKAIIKFLSITRKFGLDDKERDINGGICVTVMSPSFYRGIPKAIREELDNAFMKDEELYEYFMKRYPDGRIYSLKEVCFYKHGRRNILNERSVGEIFKVDTCSLCDETTCKVGDIIFAQKGFAFLEFGKFDTGKKLTMGDFNEFLNFTSKSIPDELPGKVLSYLKGKMNTCINCGNETPNPKFCNESCRQKYNYKNKKNGNKR